MTPDPTTRLPIPVQRPCLCGARAVAGLCYRCSQMPLGARLAFWRDLGCLPRRYPVDRYALAARVLAISCG